MSKYEHRDTSGRIIGTSERKFSDFETAEAVGTGIGTGIGLAAAALGAMGKSQDKTMVERWAKLIDAEKYPEALTEASRLVTRHKKDGGAYFFRAQTYLLNDQPKEAINDLNHAFDMEYGLDNEIIRAQAYSLRAQGHSHLGNLSAALQDLSSAIKLDPSDADYWLSRSVSILKVGDVEQALLNVNQAIEINPGDANTYYQRAQVHRAAGGTPAAQADIERAIRLNEDNPKYYQLRSQISADLGNMLASEADLRRAKEIEQSAEQLAELEKASRQAAERTTAAKNASSSANFVAFTAIASLLTLTFLIMSGRSGYLRHSILRALDGRIDGAGFLLMLAVVGSLLSLAGPKTITQLKELGIDNGIKRATMGTVIGCFNLVVIAVLLIFG